MNNSNDLPENLVKILYVVPEGEDEAGLTESMWALDLGNGLYELQNVPAFATELNVEDVVLCDASADGLPVIRERVRRSGNRTLRVVFHEEVTAEEAVDQVMIPLYEKGVRWEKAAPGRFMFNVPPSSDYEWIVALLRQKEAEGLLLVYEQDENGIAG